MFRDALKEVRYHPGRIVATLVAIAISVGFMAAVSIFVTTQSDALGRSASLSTSKADVVATLANTKQGVTTKQVHDAIAKVPGVGTVEQSLTTGLSLSTDAGSQMLTVYGLPSEQFRWATLTQGDWPKAATDVAISQRTADKLKVSVGQQVDAGEQKLTVTGITDEPANVFFDSAYISNAVVQSQGTSPSGTWLVKDASGADADAVVRQLYDAVAPLVDKPTEPEYPQGPDNLVVSTSRVAQQDAVKDITGSFDSMKYVLLVFSGIAAVVGMIIIANTFSILLAQRRRQIGLLRAVGASGSQVRGRFLAEALIMGALGSVVGLLLGALVARVATHFTGADYWGLTIPWQDLAIEFCVGVVLTVLAAMLPSLRATRVAPLEALQPVESSEQVKRASRVRAVVCGLLVVVGVALAVASLNAPTSPAITGPVARAVVGAMLITLGVLFGAPLFIPAVLRVMGALVRPLGATPRLAAMNAVRNPRRAAATATALMLACGLIVTLQVGTASAERTALEQIKQSYPIDITVAQYASFDAKGNVTTKALPANVLSQLRSLPNTAAEAVLQGGAVTAKDSSVSTVLAADPSTKAVSDTVPTTLGDDQALTSTRVKKGTRLVLTGNGHTVTLTTTPSKALDQDQALVSKATLAKLVATPTPQVAWVRLANPDDIGTTMTQLQKLQRGDQMLSLGGSATGAYLVKRVLNTLLMVITALLGAAVLIALIGVSNTLGLSVIERAKESALLRALGMQRGALRLMLLVEALLLALSGVLVGMLLGGFFGWLGVRSVLRQMGSTHGVQLGINLPLTLGLLLVVVLAASLASVLPGRRAANATPTEALAEQ